MGNNDEIKTSAASADWDVIVWLGMIDALYYDSTGVHCNEPGIYPRDRPVRHQVN